MYMQDHPAISQFFAVLHKEYANAEAFRHRNPRSNTKDYNLYSHIVSGMCEDSRKKMGIPEVRFFNTKRHRTGVGFAELMNGDIDSLDSGFAFIPTPAERVTEVDMEHLERLVLPEPYASLPKFTIASGGGAKVASPTKGVESKAESVVAMLFIRDIDWQLYESSFLTWLDTKKPRYLLNRQPFDNTVYDSCVFWTIEIAVS
jgi:hypothetical protein